MGYRNSISGAILGGCNTLAMRLIPGRLDRSPVMFESARSAVEKSGVKPARRIGLSVISLIVGLGIAIGIPSAHSAPTEMTIGVLAFRGAEDALERWSSTAEYLGTRIPEYRFRIVPLTLESISSRVAADQLDFILTNTGNYVVLEDAYGISRLATLKVRHLGRAFTQFGAVIFTRSDRDDLNRLEDVAGKSMMAVSRNAFGGFQMAWRELTAAGVNPFKDLSQLRFIGFPQDDIVHSVIDGRVDLGTVRSGTLERMAADGLIELGQVKALGARDNPGFPFLHSTRLYPEWPFAKARKTPEALAQKVAIALLELEPDSEAARQALAAGWTIPLDYGPVHDLFRELKVGPYEHLNKPDLALIWREYRGWILLTLVLMVLLMLLLYLIFRAEMKRREQALQVQLAHIARVNSMGEMAAGIAHELNQPLTAILNYTSGCLRLLQKRDNGDGEALREAIVKAGNDARRAADIIQGLREFIKREELSKRNVSIRACIEPAIELLRPRLRQSQIGIGLEYAPDLPDIHADRIQIEQVAVNLLLNAIDALRSEGSVTGERKIFVDVSLPDSRHVAVAISDNGPPLQSDVAGRLFDPFFTTKPEGMGLGLSISRSIIESHGGTIEYLLNSRDMPTICFNLPLQ